GTCRDRFASAEEATAVSGRPAAWRFRVPDEPVRICDQFAGEVTVDIAARGGDFVVFNNRGAAAYQLAVTVDDADTGVDAVVRGHDLLDSAARQMLIRRALGLAPEPAYWHVPLVVGTDGRRLAKRHGDTRIDTYRQRGAPPERLLGLLGHLSGLCDDGPREMSLVELSERFDLARVPAEEVVLASDHKAFLDG
ncbi:MAG: glutamate--tRNA ligase family protein, partial [Planctomycetota bacterium]